MSNWLANYVTGNEELLRKYFDKEEYKDNAKFVVKEDKSIELQLTGPSFFLDEIEKMIEENPEEDILWNYHYTDLYAYDGEHYFERKEGINKEWVDTTTITEDDLED